MYICTYKSFHNKDRQLISFKSLIILGPRLKHHGFVAKESSSTRTHVYVLMYRPVLICMYFLVSSQKKKKKLIYIYSSRHQFHGIPKKKVERHIARLRQCVRFKSNHALFMHELA